MTSVQVYATVHNTPMPYILLYNIWYSDFKRETLFAKELLIYIRKLELENRTYL